MSGLMVAGRISPHWGVEVAGAGVYLPASEVASYFRFGELQKSVAMLVWSVAVLFLPVLGVMQTVQRAEFWGAIVAMQAFWPCHLGINNYNVARTVGRLLDRDCLAKPLP